MAELQLTHLSAGYAARRVLDNVTLTLPAGRLTAILGPNGSGKTTLLRALAGVLPLLEGGVVWQADDATADLARLSHRARAGYVAYVPQLGDGQIPLTVFDVLDIAVRVNAPTPDLANERLKDTLDHFGLTQLAAFRCDSLSGGQLRRVMLAQGYAQSTPILLLDEPAAFLDPPAKHEMLGLLRDLAHSKGVCVVCVLHDPELALDYADTVVALGNSGVLACGAPTTVLVPATLEQLYNTSAAWWRGGETHA